MRKFINYVVSLAILAMAILWTFQQHHLARDMHQQQQTIEEMIKVQRGIIEIEKFRLCRAGDFIPNYEKPEFCAKP